MPALIGATEGGNCLRPLVLIFRDQAEVECAGCVVSFIRALEC
jgi:hypothetical protein